MKRNRIFINALCWFCTLLVFVLVQAGCNGITNSKDDEDKTYTAIISTGINSVLHESAIAFSDRQGKRLYSRLINANGRRRTGDEYQWYWNGTPLSGESEEESGQLAVKGPQAAAGTSGLTVDEGDKIMAVITYEGRQYVTPVTTVNITN